MKNILVQEESVDLRMGNGFGIFFRRASVVSKFCHQDNCILKPFVKELRCSGSRLPRNHEKHLGSGTNCRFTYRDMDLGYFSSVLAL